MIDINRINKTFDDYVKSYDMNDELISLKYYHTYRVAENSKGICKSLNLNQENTNIAYAIAMLHDIGRFEQAKVYKTFNDLKSIDHADFGCKILFEDGLIRRFIKDNKYDEIIRKSILYHNKYEIGECNEEELLHSKIIRDADKIDIINDVVNLGNIKINEDANGVSGKVKEQFDSEKIIDRKYKQYKNDSVITMIAFVFDLNFKYSYKYYKDNKFMDKMLNKLNNKEVFKYYIDKAKEYIERKC
ncbi:MAG: HD domain-containing protein [Bacilli bacterium]|nr:HD domain-containing protein [Bacilli bacterium]